MNVTTRRLRYLSSQGACRSGHDLRPGVSEERQAWLWQCRESCVQVVNAMPVQFHTILAELGDDVSTVGVHRAVVNTERACNLFAAHVDRDQIADFLFTSAQGRFAAVIIDEFGQNQGVKIKNQGNQGVRLVDFSSKNSFDLRSRPINQRV